MSGEAYLQHVFTVIRRGRLMTLMLFYHSYAMRVVSGLDGGHAVVFCTGRLLFGQKAIYLIDT
jgi:hypothetical protein